MSSEADNAPSSDSGSVGDVGFNDDREWQDIEPDEEKISVTSLFDEAVFPDIRSMLQYCKEKYGFDLEMVKGQLGVYGFCPSIWAFSS